MATVNQVRRWIGILLATSVVLASGCGEGEAEVDPEEYLSGIVSIGVNIDLPGWSEYSNGVWDGFDITLGNWLSREIGFDPQYVPLTTDERMSRLTEASEIKLVIANFSMTDERREDIDFSGPYLTDAQGVMTLAGSPVRTLDDIENKTVCVTLGSTGETRLLAGKRINPLSENTIQRCVDRVRDGSAYAFSTDRVLLDGIVAHDPGRSLRVVPDIRFGHERYGIGVRNNRPGLCNFLRGKLAKFIDEEWDDTFRSKLPGVSPKDRKPNSRDLTPCEKPS
ncbi:glutamate-binding protein [Plantactinospora endophytica]|uniref:Glutamate-binding protein n=2 Tax=Plantactinospora endophytica TaxID=673535 RepID=A0ABQ4DW27_9ACTN|nr:glutamate-binding protein [Plantactinospora endophytica]